MCTINRILACQCTAGLITLRDKTKWTTIIDLSIIQSYTVIQLPSKSVIKMCILINQDNAAIRRRRRRFSNNIGTIFSEQ